MCLPHIDIFRVYDGKCSQFIVYGNSYDLYIKNVWINSHHFKENQKQKMNSILQNTHYKV